MIRVDSTNPPGREGPLARRIARDMRSLGLQVHTCSFAPNRPNIIATLKSPLIKNRKKRPSLLLTPHIDTVPIGKGWTCDPLGAQIKNGRIYGRGASDDKGNLACCLEVMRSLCEDKVILDYDLIMAATVDEETGSHHGIIPLLEKDILRPGAALILDADNADAIIIQKGLLHCRIKVRGKKAHGAYNWRGINAIEVAARIINRLKAHKFEYVRHPLLRKPSVNIGKIHGGDKVNIVADFCEFALDLRFLPKTRPETVLKEIHRIIKTETKTYQLEIDSLQAPYEITRKHPLVRAYTQAGRRLGVDVKIKGSEGATVMTFFGRHGIPAFATGYGTPGTAHTTDEFAELRTYYKGARILEYFVKNLPTEIISTK